MAAEDYTKLELDNDALEAYVQANGTELEKRMHGAIMPKLKKGEPLNEREGNFYLRLFIRLKLIKTDGGRDLTDIDFETLKATGMIK